VGKKQKLRRQNGERVSISTAHSQDEEEAGSSDDE
jgi:hypothetical protein